MSHPEVLGHGAVRTAARATTLFSSDLQGDRDVRTYKQLPLEVDPPLHSVFRSILTPIFSMDRVQGLAPQFRVIVDGLLAELRLREEIEVVSDLALELVIRCLGIVLGRPQDVDEWRSWGPDVWITTPTGRDGSHLQVYLDATFDEVEQQPGSDAFSVIAAATHEGEPLSRTEMCGMGNIILAGGRDTVVKLMTGFMWHLGSVPSDYQLLAEDFTRIPRAIEELVRYLSPLPRMERVDVDGKLSADADYVWLSFISGNHDPDVFTDPHLIDLQRHPNPHLGFGAGPHACIGNLIAKAETRALLESLFTAKTRWEIVDATGIQFGTYGQSVIPDRFHSLNIRWVN